MGTLFCWMTQKGTGQTENDLPSSGGVRITASVGQNGANQAADVKIVQNLLNQASSAVGSPRKTIAVDGLVGPATIGAIREFQSAQLGFNDGRVDVNGPTLARLNKLTAPRKAPETVRLGVNAIGQTRMQSALEALPIAKGFVLLGTVHLRGLQSGLQANGGDPNLLFAGVANIVNTHFHLDRSPNSFVANVGTLIRRFDLISQVFGSPDLFFEEGDAILGQTDKNGNPLTFFATAAFGGFHPRPLTQRIVIRPPFVRAGLNTRASMLIHECAHYIGGPDGPNAIRHNAAEFPVLDGQAVENSTNNYRNLTTDEAMHNAASYAAFAIHAATFIDSRFGGRDITL